jgi:hypothetical protein
MPLDRKPLARVQSRDVRITIRFTEAEAERLRAKAAARDIEVSRLARRWLRMGESMDDAMPEGKAALA